MIFQLTETEIFYEEHGKKLAYIQFTKHNQVLHIVSTVVDESLRGQGLAKQLFDTLVGYIRENHFKLTTSCWYIEKLLKQTHLYDDIKKED